VGWLDVRLARPSKKELETINWNCRNNRSNHCAVDANLENGTGIGGKDGNEKTEHQQIND
jgi:hypothetical protein